MFSSQIVFLFVMQARSSHILKSTDSHLDRTERRIIARIDHRACLLDLSYQLSCIRPENGKAETERSLEQFYTSFIASVPYIRNAESLERITEAIVYRIHLLDSSNFPLYALRLLGVLSCAVLNVYEHASVSVQTQADFTECIRSFQEAGVLAG